MECCGKLLYTTRKDADRSKVFLKGHRMESRKLRVYRCVLGNGYHLTHQKGTKRPTTALEREDLQYMEASL